MMGQASFWHPGAPKHSKASMPPRRIPPAGWLVGSHSGAADLFSTLETGESGSDALFFPGHPPSLPAASFNRGCREWVPGSTKDNACTQTSQEGQNKKAACWRTHWPEDSAESRKNGQGYHLTCMPGLETQKLLDLTVRQNSKVSLFVAGTDSTLKEKYLLFPILPSIICKNPSGSIVWKPPRPNSVRALTFND